MAVAYSILVGCFNFIKGNHSTLFFEIFFSLVAGWLSYLATKALMAAVQKEARREFATWLFGLAEQLRQAESAENRHPNISKVKHALEKAARDLCEKTTR